MALDPGSLWNLKDEKTRRGMLVVADVGIGHSPRIAIGLNHDLLHGNVAVEVHPDRKVAEVFADALLTS